MRSKPILSPVVSALERQMAVNQFLLDEINRLRAQMGEEQPLSLPAEAQLIDGTPVAVAPVKATEVVDCPRQTASVSNPVTPAAPSPTPGASAPQRETCYAQALTPIEQGLGLCCDAFDLMSDEGDYIFVKAGDGTADFMINPASANDLLRPTRRNEWSRVVKVSGEIPAITGGQTYHINIVRYGKAECNNDFWVITEPAEISVSVTEQQ